MDYQQIVKALMGAAAGPAGMAASGRPSGMAGSIAAHAAGGMAGGAAGGAAGGVMPRPAPAPAPMQTAGGMAGMAGPIAAQAAGGAVTENELMRMLASGALAGGAAGAGRGVAPPAPMQARPAPMQAAGEAAGLGGAAGGVMPLLPRVEAQMRQELGTEGMGGDGWYVERSNRVIDALGPEKFYTMPLGEAVKVLGMNVQVPPQMQAWYNTLSPAQKIQMWDKEINASPMPASSFGQRR